MEENRSFVSPDYNDSIVVLVPLPSLPSKQHSTTNTSQTSFKDLIGLFFMVILNVLALVANTAVLVAVVKAPHLRKFAFVSHLCAVDLLCAVVLIPLEILVSSPYFAGVLFTILECQLYIFVNATLIAASIFTITVISVERYYYIVHPMRYEVKMTLRLTFVVMVMEWLASLALGLSTVFGWHSSSDLNTIHPAYCVLHWERSNQRQVFSVLFCVVCFLVPALVIFSVYCSVYKVARVAARHHGPLPSWTQSKQRSDSINSQTTIITTRTAPLRIVRERPFGGGKAALTLVLIVGQFLICWLPYFAFHFHASVSTTSKIPGDLDKAVTWLAYTSFAMNPFFYGLLNRQIREELCKLRRCYAGLPTDLVSSHEGSGHENFLQFLHRTSCTMDTRESFTASSPRSTLDQTGQCGFRIPGQIPEEFT
ncbi:probable G-protein coupled receptor [Boleophthalmus pectinirostris]|uniref:probable G-protein coupled receptor n=1 Tax=Boleophthalmus pectinirostris TaxID=150288 RepID=UPI00242B3818|nr:probable G-protein coupled receptor [Boleophthalmus pectinirostris]